MGDITGSKESSVDLGNELLHVPSLWEFFIEKTSIDAKKWHTSRVSSPPWGILIGLMAATAFFGFLKSMLAILAGVFSLGVLIWIVFLRNGNSQNTAEFVMSNVHNGIFPPELKDSITRRLRWWSTLIVPSEWTMNSKVFFLKDKLTKRLESLDAEIMYWNSPEGAATLQELHESEEAAQIRQEQYQKKLSLLKSRGVNVNEELEGGNDKKNKKISERYRDPAKLIKLLRSKGDCDRQLERISALIDPIERANEEIVFANALMMHCDKIIKMIEESEKLNVSVDSIKSDNLNEKVKEIITVLERKRNLVGRLNRISPKRVLGILDYNPAKAQSEISMERYINGSK